MIKLPYPGTLLFYRRLLKTMMMTFDGDFEMFHRVRLEARKEILKNKDETDEVQIQNHIFYGEEIRDFLSVNLIQVTCSNYYGNFNHLSFKTGQYST